jgi:hypothetical protein
MISPLLYGVAVVLGLPLGPDALMDKFSDTSKPSNVTHGGGEIALDHHGLLG